MNIFFECTYCGHHFKEYVWNKSAVAEKICPKCKDKNLKILGTDEGEKRDVFGYEVKVTKIKSGY